MIFNILSDVLTLELIIDHPSTHIEMDFLESR
jgi:hypothetical protein